MVVDKLTLAGAAWLSGVLPRVIIDDFDPKGTVFSVGVTGVQGEFGIGEEVAVYHGDELRGIGLALAQPSDMTSYRCAAVKIRHRRRPDRT